VLQYKSFVLLKYCLQQVENGLIVVAYKDGSPAHVHQLDSKLLLEFWHKWLRRLEGFVEEK